MIVVETVLSGAEAARAGVQAGDRLLTYDGLPLPSPAALSALEDNTVGLQSLLLALERAGQRIECAVSHGSLGLHTRPDLSDELRQTYEIARTLFLEGDFAGAGRQWEQTAFEATDAASKSWLLSKAGEAWEKLPDRQQALRIYRAVWETLSQTGTSASLSQAARSLGQCHEGESEWEEARRWYERAAQIDQELDFEIWQALNICKMGSVSLSQGYMQAAQEYYHQALAIRERLAPNSLDVAASLDYLGIHAIVRGDLQGAQDYITRALTIQEHLAPNSLDVAFSINHLGTVAASGGDIKAAKEYYNRALTIRERLAPNSLDVASTLNNLGSVASHRGDLNAAHDYYSRALAIRERLAPNSLAVAHSNNSLGILAADRGDLKVAQSYYLRALKIQERIAPNSLQVAHSLNSIGVLAFDRGDMLAAQDYYNRALKIREQHAPNSLDVAACLNNLGVVALNRGDLKAAQDYQVRALMIREQLAPGSLFVAHSLNNLGQLAHDVGDLQVARAYYTRALTIQERVSPNSLDLVSILNNLGEVAQKCGDLQVALDDHARALTIQERLAPNSLEAADTLNFLGRILLYQQQPEQALPYLQRAVEVLEQQRERIDSTEKRALLTAKHADKYASLIECYIALEQPEQAFATLERSRARSLLELLSERHLDFAMDAPSDLLDQQQALDQQREDTYAQLAQLSAGAEAFEQVDALQSQLRDLDRQQQELTARIRAASPRYASLQYPRPLDCRQSQAALEAGSLLLSYLVDKEQTYLFALRDTCIEVFKLPIGQEALQEQVHKFRRSLDVRRLDYEPAKAIDLANQLYRQLIGPVQSLVTASKRLLLCPDGPLHSLPFAALVTKSGRRPHYLGMEKPLHSVISMTVYAQMLPQLPLETPTRREPKAGAPTSASETPASPPRLLALGDPLYAPIRPGTAPAFARTGAVSEALSEDTGPDTETSFVPDAELAQVQTRGLTLSALPHTRTEVENLAKLFGNTAKIKLGIDATKTAALKESGEADIVHFACHGWMDAQMPLNSGLILSQPEAMGEHTLEGDNGLLQAWEIMQKLRLKADLVVLSACQTGLGQEIRGEGLIGLTRAFQYAGAKSLVVSLWEVADASTSHFMQAFYTAWQAGMSKDEALQQGVKALKAKPRWNYPYYWSAFLLIGDRN